MRVAVIIPAFNEEARIAAVLDALAECRSLWDEVIVVDDASRDGTAAVARGCEWVTLVELPVNRGKGAAMWAGARACEADVLCFLDADLRGLRPEHVRSLIEPVRAGTADMTIGLFQGGRGCTDFSHRITPWVSGQRGIRRSLFLELPQVSDVRQGVEALLTRAAQARDWRVVDVAWAGVTHAMKEEKLGVVRGFLARLRMYAEITAGLLASPGSVTKRADEAAPELRRATHPPAD